MKNWGTYIPGKIVPALEEHALLFVELDECSSEREAVVILTEDLGGLYERSC